MIGVEVSIRLEANVTARSSASKTTMSTNERSSTQVDAAVKRGMAQFMVVCAGEDGTVSGDVWCELAHSNELMNSLLSSLSPVRA